MRIVVAIAFLLILGSLASALFFLMGVAAGLVGGLGFASSANLGDNVAMFEAVHGSAPTIAGKNVANPTALMLTTAMLLRYLDELDAAAAIPVATARRPGGRCRDASCLQLRNRHGGDCCRRRCRNESE